MRNAKDVAYSAPAVVPLRDVAVADRLSRSNFARGRLLETLRKYLDPYYVADIDGNLTETNPGFDQLCTTLFRRPAPNPGDSAPGRLRRIWGGRG